MVDNVLDERDDNRLKISKNHLKFGPVMMSRTSEVPSGSEGRLGDIVIVDDTAGSSTIPIADRIPTSVEMYQKSGSNTWSRVLNASDILDSEQFAQWTTNRTVIAQKSDFPDPVDGVITLEDNTSYLIVDQIDLGTDRIVAGTNNTLTGYFNRSASITSDLNGEHLFTTTSNLMLSDLTLSAGSNGIIISSDGSDSVWMRDIVISGTGSCGTVNDCGAFIAIRLVAINLDALSVTGTMRTFVAESTVWSVTGSGKTILDFSDDITISNRIRISFSSFTVDTGSNGINIPNNITLGDETLVVIGNTFSGDGTYFPDVGPSDNRSYFKSNVAIDDSDAYVEYTMSNNAVATDIVTQGTYVKVAGTTAVGAAQRFDTSVPNRAVYTGFRSTQFLVNINANITGANNVQVSVSIGRNGTPNTTYVGTTVLSGTGSAFGLSISSILTLNPNDYVELFVANNTSITDVTVTGLNVVLTEV